ncbi:FRG domain-containing protein [Vibrio splendidus]|uniref:FRG domain-containing protein n=1 Tax=Vibrio splendidus TaxID=29497 RepID=UPI0015E765ED|nr:FRG domain-containing protein [Vibrio splendidus]
MENILEYKQKETNGHINNVYQYKNIISPFCNKEVTTNLSSTGNIVIDKNYGLTYDRELIQHHAAVYGYEEAIPDYSGDQLVTDGYLRVPFRKIPRINISNRVELDALLSSIESRDPNLKLLFRGQNSEYFIKRKAEENLALYGSETVLEPSLIPSAVRRNVLIEDVMPLWNSMLHTYLDKNILSLPIHEQKIASRELANFKISPKFGMFSLALAQHYGLPSVGLDATDNIETALFFATHKFETTNGSSSYTYNLHEMTERPVIYILSPPEKFHLDYDDFKPAGLDFLRPDKQGAKFLHTGWGLNQNRCARHIWIALYLDPCGDFGSISKAEDLFPKTDSFANEIKPIIDMIINEKLSPYFENFYTL